MRTPANQEFIDEVNATTDAEDGALAVITRQADELEADAAVANDFAELKQIVADNVTKLRDHAAPLAAAVAANTPAAPASPVLTLGGPSGSLDVGGTEQLTASASDGSSVTSYVSSDPSVATVDDAGVVTGVAAGTASIAAATGTCSASFDVTVG